LRNSPVKQIVTFLTARALLISHAMFSEARYTLPLGSVGYEPQLNAKEERLVWIESAIVDCLAAMRSPGESHGEAPRLRGLIGLENDLAIIDRWPTITQGAPELGLRFSRTQLASK
jgi:hypothetical protein